MSCIAIAIGLLAALPGTHAAAGEAEAFARSHDLLRERCLECHNADTRSGGLNLDDLKWLPDEPANFDTWTKLFDRVRLGEMPPPDAEPLDPSARSALLQGIEQSLDAASASKLQQQGRTVLRRLNRVEYENTLHDLLGISVPLKHILPEDPTTDGFDTVADGLRISPLHLEKYLEAADTAIDAAIALGEKPATTRQRFSYKKDKHVRKNLDTPAGTFDPESNSKHQSIFRELSDAVVFFSDSYSPTELHDFPGAIAGDYRIRISAYGWKSRGRPVTMKVYTTNGDRRLLTYFEMPPDQPREVEFIARLNNHEKIHIVPDDTGYDESGQNIWQHADGPRFDGIGLAVQWVELEGPLVEGWPPPSVTKLIDPQYVRTLAEKDRRWYSGRLHHYEIAADDPHAAASTIVENFAQRAFRRPLEPGEVEPYVTLATRSLEAGETLEDAVRVACRAVLTAPQFLVLEERVGKLSSYELASRLSYFLWSSMPDDELLRTAADGTLADKAVLHAQVERMLAHPKSQRFVTNFTGQWLQLRSIDATSPDTNLYPEYDEMLRVSMLGETEAFFRELLDKDLSIASFIESDFLMLNRRIARHYGVDGILSEQFQRVPVPPESPRGGVLTQASLLKVTANGTVTSPVRRGAWISKNLLGRTIPPPPPVPAIEPDTRGATTIRELLAKHRSSDSCNSCHKYMDPPGLALENFDVIGGWRERYRSLGEGERPTYKLKGQDIWQYKLGPQVDASSELVDGRNFRDISQLKRLLLTEQDRVTHCLTEKLLTYSTGASMQFADRNEVRAIAARTVSAGNGLRTLVHEVVLSNIFRNK